MCLCCTAGQYDAAKEGLLKLGDVAGLLQLNVEEQRWEDAFLLLAAHSGLKDQVYLPYAKWLLSQDRCVCWVCVDSFLAQVLLTSRAQSGPLGPRVRTRVCLCMLAPAQLADGHAVMCYRFEEACAAHTEGGRPELGVALLQRLADNAVLQFRFADAAHGYYTLAMQSLKVLSGLGTTAGTTCCKGPALSCSALSRASVLSAMACLKPLLGRLLTCGCCMITPA